MDGLSPKVMYAELLKYVDRQAARSDVMLETLGRIADALEGTLKFYQAQVAAVESEMAKQAGQQTQ